MEDWILKPDLRADWISLVFFINILFILLMYRLDSRRFLGLLNLFKMHQYFGKYAHEKKLNYLSYFNILSLFLIASSLAMAYFSISEYLPHTFHFGFEFLLLLMGLIILFPIRFYTIQFIAKQLGFLALLTPLLYKNFTYATQLAIYLTAVLIFKNYSIFPIIFFDFLIIFLFLLWVYQQFRIIFPFLKTHLRDGFYIILYLCTFKIAPWFWIYFLCIETQM